MQRVIVLLCLEKLAAPKPVFRENGAVTAGNAGGTMTASPSSWPCGGSVLCSFVVYASNVFILNSFLIGAPAGPGAGSEGTKNAAPFGNVKEERHRKLVRIFYGPVRQTFQGCGKMVGMWVRVPPVWENGPWIAKFQGPRIS